MDEDNDQWKLAMYVQAITQLTVKADPAWRNDVYPQSGCRMLSFNSNKVPDWIGVHKEGLALNSPVS